LSTIVATLLIILLVMVAVAILWGVIRTLITKSSESISIGKFTVDLQIISIRQTPQDVNVKVRRNAGEGELEGIIFAIFDGEETHIYEKRNVVLNQLETKTFVLDYQGNIVSVSIYPLFLGENGRVITGDVSDSYFMRGSGEGGYIDPNCITNCTGKECGDNGCGGQCEPGCSGATPQCMQGDCEADSGGAEPDCTCAVTTCIGTTCDDGLGGACSGQLQPDCTNELGYSIVCGVSENGCGGANACGNCDDGWHCFDGTCQEDCVVNCTGKECGDNGCGGSCGYCDILYGENYNCNAVGICEICTPDCGLKECGSIPNGCGESCGNCSELHNSSYNCNAVGICEMCTPDCGTRECGAVPNECGESCGNCSELYPGYPEDSCTIDGECVFETVLNSGVIYSIWPIDIGIYFDSEDLPKSGVDYFGYYVKFPGSSEQECIRIWDFVIPVFPPYNMSYIRLAATSTTIETGNNYEIWETYDGCCRDYFCE
jgi:hypothetical protein